MSSWSSTLAIASSIADSVPGRGASHMSARDAVLESRGSTTQWLDNTLTEANLARVRELTAIAADLGVEVGSLALAWLLRRPGITSVITGATRPEQVRANLSAATIELDDEVVARIGRLFAREI